MTDLLLSAVREMRDAQKKADKSRNSFDLKKKERLEKIVDEMIEEPEDKSIALFTKP